MKQARYPWYMCVCGGLAMLCNLAFPANIFSSYIPFLLDMGYTGAQTSMLVTVRCVVGILGMLVIHRFYRAVTLRWGMALCCAFTGVGYFIMSFARGYAVYVLGAVFFGLGYGMGTAVPVSLLLTNWFERRRATAISLSMAGTGIATILFPPLVTRLAERVSLGLAFRVVGSCALSIGLCVALLVRDRPAALGLLPHGVGSDDPEGKDRPWRGSAAPVRIEYLLLAGMLLLGAVSLSSMTYFSSLFTVAGHPKASAALSITLLGIAMIVGKLFYGGAVDRFSAPPATILFLIGMMVGCLLSCLSPRHAAFMFVGTTVFGLGMAPATAGIPVLAECFSSRDDYPRLLRRMQLCFNLGGLIASGLPGRIYDLTGSYIVSYLMNVCCIAVLIAALAYAWSHRQGN